MAWRIFYIIGKLLERKYLKWACIAHSDIWNTSYNQKKGRESNWQFDSRPLKVENQPNFVTCRCRATHCWKALDKGYNFVLNLILIREMKSAREVMGRQSHRNPNFGNFETPTWESWDKKSFRCGPHGQPHSIL